MDFLYSHPYLIVLTRDLIQIYRYAVRSFVRSTRVSELPSCSYLDDQLKQDIPVKLARTVTNLQHETTRSILVTSKDNIYLLEPLSIEEQIDQLLNGYRLQEALVLAESSCPSVKQRRSNPLVIATKKRIALIEFTAMNVVRALTLFEDIHIDFHEVRIPVHLVAKATSIASSLDHLADTGFPPIDQRLARARRVSQRSVQPMAECVL